MRKVSAISKAVTTLEKHGHRVYGWINSRDDMRYDVYPKDGPIQTNLTPAQVIELAGRMEEKES